MKPLTDKQQAVLDFIKQFIAGNGYAPTVREIGSSFGICVKGAFDHINAIEKKGYISRHRGISRSITITEVSQ